MRDRRNPEPQHCPTKIRQEGGSYSEQSASTRRGVPRATSSERQLRSTSLTFEAQRPARYGVSEASERPQFQKPLCGSACTIPGGGICLYKSAVPLLVWPCPHKRRAHTSKRGRRVLKALRALAPVCGRCAVHGVDKSQAIHADQGLHNRICRKALTRF